MISCRRLPEPKNGKRPDNRTCNITPAPQISHPFPYTRLDTTSGAIYCGHPIRPDTSNGKEYKQKLDMLYKWIWFDFRNWFPYLCDIYVFINKRLFRESTCMYIVYYMSAHEILYLLRFMQILLSSIYCSSSLIQYMSLCVSVCLLLSDCATLNSRNSKAIKICANVIIIKERRKEKTKRKVTTKQLAYVKTM